MGKLLRKTPPFWYETRLLVTLSRGHTEAAYLRGGLWRRKPQGPTPRLVFLEDSGAAQQGLGVGNEWLPWFWTSGVSRPLEGAVQSAGHA